MDPITLGIAIAIMKSLPGTAAAEAAAVLERAQEAILEAQEAIDQAQEVLDSIPSDYSELIERVTVIEGLGFYKDADGYVCHE